MRRSIVILGWIAACGGVEVARPVDGLEKFRDTAAATVSWTGPDGLNVRAEPERAATRAAWLPEGATVTIECQTHGELVDGTDVWDRIEDPPGYVLDAYMKTGYADWIPGVPLCGEAGCGDVDWHGYCDGARLVWCDDDELSAVDCADSGRACAWQDADVVPRLAGARDERLTTAARVAWWSLKEGVLGLDYAFEYSNCNFPTGDAHIGPVDGCPANRAWQVGLSASQVPWPYVDVEATALALHPGDTLVDVLAWTAAEAGYDPASGVGAAIVASTGMLRRSWLLRNPAVGFTNEVEVVTAECIDASLSWCFGSGWDTSARYAPDKATAMAAIDDLYAAFDALAP
jgi:hypothetical protein